MNTAFVFSGQGAQFSGMGKELYEKFGICRGIFDRAEEVSGFPLKSICFDQDKTDALNDTRHAQAAIFTVSYAALRLFEERAGIKATVTAGLSLGEYTALAYAGALSFDDAIKLLVNRGAFMAEACEATDGAMSAILGISPEDAEKLCGEISTDAAPVNVSNINTIGQVVISGNRGAVETAEAEAKKYGGKRAIRLPVSGAYHSAYMESAAKSLGDFIKDVNFEIPKIPVISNVSGKAHLQDTEAIKNTLVTQVTAAVRWADCVKEMARMGADTFIEFGPGKALSGFITKILGSPAVYNIQDEESLESTMKGLGL